LLVAAEAVWVTLLVAEAVAVQADSERQLLLLCHRGLLLQLLLALAVRGVAVQVDRPRQQIPVEIQYSVQ
jgi:hypothetical protein